MITRYNWLRVWGYRTVAGTDYVDPWDGYEWVELIMVKGKRIKRTKLSTISLADVMALEKQEGKCPN